MDLIGHIARKDRLAAVSDAFADMPDDVLLEQINHSVDAGDDFWIPFHLYINSHNIKHLKPYLPDLLALTKKRRHEATTLLEFYFEDATRVKLPIIKACGEAGIDYRSFSYATNAQPVIWKFINVCLAEHTRNEYEGRVDKATADAALHGNHQDRRLFYELSGRLARGGSAKGGGGVNIVFVQDAMSRPGVEGRTVTIGKPRAIGELDTSPLESAE